MSHSPLYNSSNLDYTGSKTNNPYSLIQKAGKRKRKRNSRIKTKKRKTKTKTKTKTKRRNTSRRKR